MNRLDEPGVTQRLDHHPKPIEPSGPSPALLKEAITSVENLSKSIREFPEGMRQAIHLNEVACGLSLGVGVVIGLLLTILVRKAK
jgi:hypothetical protein